MLLTIAGLASYTQLHWRDERQHDKQLDMRHERGATRGRGAGGQEVAA